MRTGSHQLVNGSQLRPDQDEVTVRVPALRRYVSAVRSMTTALAAQCDLTVDEIEDVQMAIDEACALLLPHVERSRPWLEVTYHLVGLAVHRARSRSPRRNRSSSTGRTCPGPF